MRRRAIAIALLGRLEKLLRELHGFLQVLDDCLDFVCCILVAFFQQLAQLDQLPLVLVQILLNFRDVIVVPHRNRKVSVC